MTRSGGRRILLCTAVVLATGCKEAAPSPPAPSASSGAPRPTASTAAAPAGSGLEDFVAPPLGFEPSDPVPEGSGSPPQPLARGAAVAEREQKVLDLLSGKLPAANLRVEAGLERADQWVADTSRTSVPKVRIGQVTVNGALPETVVRRIVRQSFGRFRLCYEEGLRRNPRLSGRVVTRFVVGPEGAVRSVTSAGSTLPDAAVIACVVRAVHAVTFPKPDAGDVTVKFPLSLEPGG